MEDFNIGTHTRVITTTSADAQRWFDMGLNWCFGFNQEAGLACFLNALRFDPDCPMAHWGVAYACGPFYNLTWHEFGEQEAARTIQLARRHLAHARKYVTDPAERGLVDALAGRFLEPHPVAAEAYAAWDNEYSVRLRDLLQRYPDDHDIMALLVEALLTRTVRRLFDVRTGLPAPGSAVIEALAVIEHSISLANETGESQHAAIHHLHIHALEMSNEPEKALPSADILAALCPDAGHMNHMPGHIYALCGRWQQAYEASNRAIRADDLYANLPGTPKINLYVLARCHDLHLQIYACMFLGKSAPALAAADKVRGMLTEDLLRVQGRPKLAMMAEAYYSMRLHVLVRFGRWLDIVREPMPGDPDLYLVTTAMQHYARVVAFASLKRIAEAEEARIAFAASLERIPATWRYNMNPAHAILAVGAAMLAGELAYHKGDYAEAFEHLREAVQRDDDLNYCEPWPWMHPPRHALGALLAAQEHWAEAEEVYRDDLGLSDGVQRCAQHPDNVWALHGLVECLERRDERDELPGLRQKLTLALARTDVPIASSSNQILAFCQRLCHTRLSRLHRRGRPKRDPVSILLDQPSNPSQVAAKPGQRCKDAGIDCVYPPPKQSSYVLLDDCLLSNDAAGLPTSTADIRWIGDIDTATLLPALDLSVSSHQPSSAHSPSGWFLSPETWKIEPFPIQTNPNMTLFSSSVLKRYVTVIQHWLKNWVMSGSNPFIHSHLYRTRFPACVQVAYTTLSTYINRTEANSEIILRIIESRTEELLVNLSIGVTDALEPLDPLEQLARVHALMVYQFICLFDGDIRSRYLAEGRTHVLNRWAMQMVECASSSLYLLSLTLDPLDPVETTSLVDPPSLTGGTEHLWHTWILAESIRRTWLTVTGLEALYSTLQQGWAFCPGGMMFTTRQGVWEANTAFAWEKLCSETDIGFIQRFETEKFFTEASPLEIDDFGKMILESTFGTERMERWTLR